MNARNRWPSRDKWPAGEWDSEPNREQWTDEATGYPCLILRGPSGALCGYAAVPPGHRWHGADYDTPIVDVHGGLTYAAKCSGTPGEDICHIPEPGQPDDVWWFGFDCAHCFDVTPLTLAYTDGLSSGDVYRNFAYVRAEVESLTRQLAEAAS